MGLIRWLFQHSDGSPVITNEDVVYGGQKGISDRLASNMIRAPYVREEAWNIGDSLDSVAQFSKELEEEVKKMTNAENQPDVPKVEMQEKTFVEHSIDVAKEFLAEAEREYTNLTERLETFKKTSEEWVANMEDKIEHARLVKTAHEGTLSLLTQPGSKVVSPQMPPQAQVIPAAPTVNTEVKNVKPAAK